MIQIEFRASEVIAHLAELSTRIRNMTPLMRRIAGKLADAVEENFASEGAHLGRPWKPSRRALRQGGKTLQDTGRLAASITTRHDATTAAVGTNVEYAAIHQFGGQIKRKARTQTLNFRVNSLTGRSRFAKKSRANFSQDVEIGAGVTEMPARPFLDLAESDLAEIDDMIDAYIGQ